MPELKVVIVFKASWVSLDAARLRSGERESVLNGDSDLLDL